MIKSITKTTQRRRERAQTMVEFALVFPFILVITYGMIELGRMIFTYTSVTSAAREGARYGASVGDRTSYNYLDCDGIRTAVENAAFLINIDPADITIRYESTPGVIDAGKGECPASTPISRGDRIRVDVIAEYLPVINFLSFSPMEISRSSARTILTNVITGP